MRRNILCGLFMALSLGCRTASMPVRLQGDPVSIAWLAGHWAGQYWGGASGRVGALSFTLRSGTDSLYGDVMMMGSAGRAVIAADPMDVHHMHVQSAQALHIVFVRAEADSVQGMLEPYVLPDCDCVVGTTFIGRVRGDAIEGTFATRRSGALVATGRWEMHRVGDDRR